MVDEERRRRFNIAVPLLTNPALGRSMLCAALRRSNFKIKLLKNFGVLRAWSGEQRTTTPSPGELAAEDAEQWLQASAQ